MISEISAKILGRGYLTDLQRDVLPCGLL